MSDPDNCEHSGAAVTFDLDVARKLPTSSEVRQLFPRFCGICPDCGTQLIKYASAEHYVLGDW